MVRWLSLMVLLSGCAAKGTYHIIQAEQAVQLATDDGADTLAVYAWTMSDSYLKKAREEYSYADYEAAERYALEAERWAERARDVVRMADDPMNSATEALPELRDATPEETNSIFDNSDDDIEFDLEDE